MTCEATSMTPQGKAQQPTRVIGLMSGTSHDAIDAACVDIHVEEGNVLVLRRLGMLSQQYDADLDAALTEALPPGKVSMRDVCKLDTLIGQAFAQTAQAADIQLCDSRAQLAVSHGQTLYHWVENGNVRGTLQLGQAAWIAEATGMTVVSDLRSRDVAAGGQGAPLVSFFDSLWLRGQNAAAVNLGGIANVTLLTSSNPIAFDTGPANALIDAVIREKTGGEQHYDVDGQLATKGTVDDVLLSELMREEYYRQSPPKTTGKELFNRDYVDAFPRARELSLEDLVATLTQLTARTVTQALVGVKEVVLSGGGTKNVALVRAIEALLPSAKVHTSDQLGLPSQEKEAVAFAVLGFLTFNGQMGNAPTCTGAKGGRILGTTIPGDRSISKALYEAPVALRIEDV